MMMLMTSWSGCINIRQNNFQGKNITDKENDFFYDKWVNSSGWQRMLNLFCISYHTYNIHIARSDRSIKRNREFHIRARNFNTCLYN